jgi:hypothetical protein
VAVRKQFTPEPVPDGEDEETSADPDGSDDYRADRGRADGVMYFSHPSGVWIRGWVQDGGIYVFLGA